MENLKFAHRGNILFCALKGNVTLDTFEKYRDAIERAIEETEPDALVMELSSVTSIDGSGVGLIVDLAYHLKGQSRQFILFKPNSNVLDALKRLRLDNFFLSVDDQEELLTMLPWEEDSLCSR